jgi:hypothetical protein
LRLDDTDNIKKIIGANSALSFQEKRNRFGDALERFYNR